MFGGGSSSRSSSGGNTPSRMSSTSPSPSARSSFPKLLSDKYRLGEELGRGAYGVVYRGMDMRTGTHVAIKQLSLDRIPQDSLQGIMNEVELLKNLNHKNIVKYLGSCRTKTHLYIILEYMENGALSTIIRANKFGPFPESLVAVYIQQVLQGLAYLHEQGVVHRDIKGANILTTKEGLVKLADFGVAAKLGELEAERSAGREAAPVGTPYWMAPEVVELKSVTTAADIWSVGCLAIELLTGNPPYYDLQPMSALYNIVQDPHPPLPPDISMGMEDFLRKCFQKDPSGRPSARQLLQHSWITYNRRTLRSSWSRTRGLKARGARTDAHATVSTVVERMLQVETDEVDAVAVLGVNGSQSQLSQSPTKAVAGYSPSAPPPLPLPPQSPAAQQQAALALQQQQIYGAQPAFAAAQPMYQPQQQQQQQAYLMQQQQQQQQQYLQQQQQPSPMGGPATLGPLARASQFRVPPLPVGAVASDSASSTLTYPTPPASALTPRGGYYAPSAASSQSTEGPLAAGFAVVTGAAVQVPPSIPMQPQQQHQQQQYAGLPQPPPSFQHQQLVEQQQQLPASPQLVSLQPPQQQQQPIQPLPHVFPAVGAVPAWRPGAAVAGLLDATRTTAGSSSAAEDPVGSLLLGTLEAQQDAARREGAGGAPSPSSSAAVGAAGPQGSRANLAADDVDAAARQAVVEVQRQVASMRVTHPAERNMVQEAAATASAKELLGYVRGDPALKSVFVAADGLSALLELLDCASERVLMPALHLLLALVSDDPAALIASSRLGLVPAALRLTRACAAGTAAASLDVRLAAAQYLEALCCAAHVAAADGAAVDGDVIEKPSVQSSGSSACTAGIEALVSCGGVGGLLCLVEENGLLQAPQQLLMLQIGLGCLWSVLHHSASPASPLSLNQCLRLMSQQGAAPKLVAVLPRVMQERAVALEQWRAAGGGAGPPSAPSVKSSPSRHSRSSSTPQTEAELSLLSADSLAQLQRHGPPPTIPEESEGSVLQSAASAPFLAGTVQPPGSLSTGSRKLRTTQTVSGRGAPESAAENGVSSGSGNPQAEAYHRLNGLLESVINLLTVMSHGDGLVKVRMGSRQTLEPLFALFRSLEPRLQLRVLKLVHSLAGDKEALDLLESAGAVPFLMACLESAEPGQQAQALGALHALCQLSRPRQEQAAVCKAAGPLCRVALASPTHDPRAQALPASVRGLAVSILCGMAHGGPRTLVELRDAHALDALLRLLKEEAYQEPVLDALAAWLDSDTSRVEARLLEQSATDRLVLLLPTIATAGDFEALSRLLTPLLRLLRRSSRLAAELAQRGLAARVMELLKKPNAHTCLSLLDILRVLYENHPNPKEFIMKYRVQQTLHALAHGQSARDAVLVRKQAQNLLDAFQVNLVF
ncbi:hypothetical protein N2152v2_002208 [Parachlorella kessleri]